jgi:hypothetical protein
VRYKSSSSPHWVGVAGIERINNTDYLKIAPSSSNDISFSEDSSRAKEGWIRKDDGTVLVPVNKTMEYVTYSTPNSF